MPVIRMKGKGFAGRRDGQRGYAVVESLRGVELHTPNTPCLLYYSCAQGVNGVWPSGQASGRLERSLWIE